MEKMMPLLTKRDSLCGAIIYGLGDCCAALLTDEFQISRLIGMMILGGTLYAIEIPGYFAWIERSFKKRGIVNAITRALIAQAFFNPLWIARHIAFIKCFSGQFAAIQWNLIGMGMDSFVQIVPFSLLVNYAIQNVIPYNWRFLTSAFFSTLMAIYYALTEVLFG
jgi:hypothetical protein